MFLGTHTARRENGLETEKVVQGSMPGQAPHIVTPSDTCHKRAPAPIDEHEPKRAKHHVTTTATRAARTGSEQASDGSNTMHDSNIPDLPTYEAQRAVYHDVTAGLVRAGARPIEHFERQIEQSFM